MSIRVKPTRSWLYIPGTRPDRFANAGATGADVLIIDLEDAVAPDDKLKARATVIDYLASPASDKVTQALRINGLDTATGIADVDALLRSEAKPDFLVLPRADGPGHLHILDRLLAAKPLDTRLVGLVESARPGGRGSHRGGNAAAVRADAGRGGHGGRSGHGDRLGAACCSA